jgi:hypothetical protein
VYHFTNGKWAQLPNPTTTSSLVCGDTSSFSPFAVGNVNAPNNFSLINEVILPEVARTMVDETVGTIGRRIRQARTKGKDSGARFNFSGDKGLIDALVANTSKQGEGELDMEKILKQTLNGANFALPLNASEGNSSGLGGSELTLWGGGGYRGLGGNEKKVQWDGELSSFYLGIDGRPRSDVLLGVTLAFVEGSFDYNDSNNNGSKGDYDIEMLSVYPYIGWNSDVLDIWATGGYGEGDIEIKPDGNAKGSCDADMLSGAVGASGDLYSKDSTTLRLKSEASTVQMEVEANKKSSCLSAGDNKLSINSHRFRLALELEKTISLANNSSLSSALEIGIRYDAGDGESGGGVELGGSLSYSAPAAGLTIEGKVRGLVAHEASYKDWGMSGLIRFAPGANGHGLSFSLQPTYGKLDGSKEQLWNQGVADLPNTNNSSNAARLAAELAYGMSAFNGRGLFSPYASVTMSNTDGQQYRLGSRLNINSIFDIYVEGTQHINKAGKAENSVLLEGKLRF